MNHSTTSSIEKTLAERGNRYGDFKDHALIAQSLQDDMRETDGWHRLDATKRQALTVIADKIARILSGDPEYADNWHDIQGYAKLVEDRLSVVVVEAKPVEDSDGWIPHNPVAGAVSPVGRTVKVLARLRDGTELRQRESAYRYWDDTPSEQKRIVAYKIAE